MRRFGLSKRITRCRNLHGAVDGGCNGLVGARCEPDPATVTCEVTFGSSVSATQRAYVLTQADLFCRMCGAAPGDIDDFTGCRAKFHIEPIARGGAAVKGESANLQTLCSTCNQGAKNITTVKPPAIWLLSQIRRAGQEEQLAVLNFLLKKFKK
jgi:hypothetical protein